VLSIPKSRKIELLPTTKQKKIINDWVAAIRKVYNVCLHHINTLYKEGVKDEKDILNEFALRDRFVTKKNMAQDELESMGWTLRTPSRIRADAVKQIITSFKACITRTKKYQIRGFKINPKNKADNRQTILLPQESSRIRNSKLKVCGLKLDLSEKMADSEIASNMRMTRTNGRYYVFITEFVEAKQKLNKKGVVGIDPGFRSPFTFYAPRGEFGTIGMGLDKQLYRKYKKMSAIQNSTSISIGRKRNHLDKHQRRIDSKVDDFQWKTVHWFLSEFNRIIIPSLYVRNLKGSQMRLQKDLKHCQFISRLISTSVGYSDVEVHQCKEHYTSMTCTNCGSLRKQKDRTVACRDCKFVIHRDVAGARNMVVKHMHMQPPVEVQD